MSTRHRQGLWCELSSLTSAEVTELRKEGVTNKGVHLAYQFCSTLARAFEDTFVLVYFTTSGESCKD